MRKYLFTFNFEEYTQRSYMINWLKERKIDFFDYMQCLHADVFGTDEYCKLEAVHVCGNTFEVYYYPEKTVERGGLSRLYPLVEKAIKVDTPCHSVKVTFANDDSITTRINGCKDEIEAYYLNNIFNVGSVEDNLQKAIAVEFLK